MPRTQPKGPICIYLFANQPWRTQKKCQIATLPDRHVAFDNVS